MKIKILFFSTLIVLPSAYISHAQTMTAKVPAATTAIVTDPVTSGKFYVKGYGGYGLLTPGSYRLGIVNSTTNAFSVGSKALGFGLHFGGGVGYILNDFLNLGLDADYLAKENLTASMHSVGSNSIEYFDHASNKQSILSLVPNITFKALSKPTYFIYTRIGILLTVNTKFELDANDSVSYHGNNGSDDRAMYNDAKIIKNKLSAGVQVAPGIQFAVTGHIRGFAEIIGNYLPVSPSSYTKNDVNRFYDIHNNPTHTDTPPPVTVSFVKTRTADYQEPSTTFSFNYIGINIGIAYRF